MNKYISYEPGYDETGHFCLKIHKSRGSLTIEEIKEVARSYDEDHYVMILNCLDNSNCSQDFGEEPEGHTVTLYKIWESENE